MEMRRQHVLPVWTGCGLAILGLLVLVTSFFLPPLYFVPCFDSCAQPQRYATAWAFSLTLLADLPYSPLVNVCILMLCYLPLLAAVMIVGCLLSFLVRPHRAFAMWSHRLWLAGSVALVLLLLVVLFLASIFGGGPEKGFFGLLLGYGLLWAGDRVVRNNTSSV